MYALCRILYVQFAEKACTKNRMFHLFQLHKTNYDNNNYDKSYYCITKMSKQHFERTFNDGLPIIWSEGTVLHVEDIRHW